MSDLHIWFAWVVVISNGVCGAWITAAHWSPVVRHRSMWVAVNLAFATVAVQVSIGAWLVAGEDIEVEQIHTFYGFLTLVAVGLIVAYRHLSEYRYLLYGLGSLFIMGLGIRAMVLSPVA